MNKNVEKEKKNDARWWYCDGVYEKGPLTTEAMMHACSVGEVSPITRTSHDGKLSWNVASFFHELWGREREESDEAGRWLIAANEEQCNESHEFAMLQMYAAQGFLRRKDLVKELPNGSWQAAGGVPGIFDGRRQWCVRCGAQLIDYSRCSHCNAVQPDYAPTNSTGAFVIGILALAFYFVGVLLLSAAIYNDWTVMGAGIEEHFLEFFLIVLAVPLGLASMAIFFGLYARTAIQKGRDSPAFLGRALWGLRFGIASASLVAVTLIALIGFGVRHFN